MPIIRLERSGINVEGPSFRMPSYAGGLDERTEAVTALASLVSGAMMGINKEKQHGHDWISMAMDWYNPNAGSFVISPSDAPGESYWYDLISCILAFQIADLYPHRRDFESAMKSTAELWYQALLVLGGPDACFRHTAFDTTKMTSVDNGRWMEPDAAAGIAWMMYMAWERFGDKKFLDAARWCIEFLYSWDPDDGNPVYEILLYYAPIVVARLNQFHGHQYDIDVLLKWIFSENRDLPTVRRDWGMAFEAYGEYDVHGLLGSVGDGDGYMFAMNSFHTPAIMAPLVKYDASLADLVGRWLLNVINNARLFMPDKLPPMNQGFPDWNPGLNHAYAYEGLRKRKFLLADKVHEPETRQLAFSSIDTAGHVWLFRQPDKVNETWIAFAGNAERTVKKNSVRISYLCKENSEWVDFAVWPSRDTAAKDEARISALLPKGNGSGLLAVRLSPNPNVDWQEGLKINKPRLYSRNFVDVTPYATGDPVVYQWHDGKAGIDIGFYGSAHIGFLAAVIETWSANGVVCFNLNATDFFSNDNYAGWLAHNPLTDSQEILIEIGDRFPALYDAVSGELVSANDLGKHRIRLESQTSRVLLNSPPGGGR